MDAAPHCKGIRPSGDVSQTLAHHGLRENRRGGRAVAGDVFGPLRHLFDEFGAHLFVRLLEVDAARDGDTVIGHERFGNVAAEHHVAPLGAKGDSDRVSERVHSPLE